MRRKRSPTHAAAQKPRPTRRIQEQTEQQEHRQLPSPAACPRCGCSFRNGRWTWEAAPENAQEHVCPACERIATDYPAGVLHVQGEFARLHREDLLGLVRNIEARERTEHPLKRIMAIADEAEGFRVTTTDAKLAEAFGRALHKAHGGSLEHPPTTSEKGNLVRIHWTRD